MLPRLLVANDLPGLGKVALASSLPLMAACQVETAILPTVLLSSHTGGFKQLRIDDYTVGMTGFLEQWQNLGIAFDGLVTGYLKNSQQIDLILEFANAKQLPLFVDPIMGDKGCFYQGFDQGHANHMRRLCQNADVIIPNLTEAAFLTKTAYLEKDYQSSQVERLLKKLAALGPSYIVLTGVTFEADKIGLAIYDRTKDKVVYLMAKHYPQHFYGTGDILTAILSSAYFRGISLEKSGRLALDFLNEVMMTTLALERDLRYGLCYEPHLLDLIKNYQLSIIIRGEKMKKEELRRLIEVSLFAALILVSVQFLRIQVGPQFVHLGNALVVIAVLVFGSGFGALAAALGLGLFDIFNGYAAEVWITILESLLVCYVLHLVYEKAMKANDKTGNYFYCWTNCCGNEDYSQSF